MHQDSNTRNKAWSRLRAHLDFVMLMIDWPIQLHKPAMPPIQTGADIGIPVPFAFRGSLSLGWSVRSSTWLRVIIDSGRPPTGQCRRTRQELIHQRFRFRGPGGKKKTPPFFFLWGPPPGGEEENRPMVSGKHHPYHPQCGIFQPQIYTPSLSSPECTPAGRGNPTLRSWAG